MPSDKHNSRTARARDLISSLSTSLHPRMCLFPNHSSYKACIMVLPLYSFDLPLFLHNHVRNEFDIAEIEPLWLSLIELWGTRFTSIFSIFSVMAGWIAEIFLHCSLLILLCNGQNIAKYEAYWLISVPIINPWCTCQPFFLAKHTNQNYYVFSKK